MKENYINKMYININSTFELLRLKLQHWFDLIILMLPNIFLAVVVLLIFIFFSKLSHNLLARVLKTFQATETIKRIIVLSLNSFIILTGIFICLDILNLEKAVTSLLAGAGLIGLAISFAFQNIATNVFSGLIIAFRKPFHVGDIIKSGEFFGTIIKIGIQNTTLATDEGQFILLPNKELWEKAIIIFTESKKREVIIHYPVSLQDDWADIQILIKNTMNNFRLLLPMTSVEVFYTKVTPYYADLSINFWIIYQNESDYDIAKGEAILEIKKTLSAAGYKLPEVKYIS